jgi:hypothetical protein
MLGERLNSKPFRSEENIKIKLMEKEGKKE